MSVTSPTFGLSPLDVKTAQAKLDKQLKYLTENTVLTNSGQLKTFKDFSMSANVSKRYYAEVTNRTNTIYSLAMDYGHKPVFITITLDGCYRDGLRGDFRDFTPEHMKCLPKHIKRKIKSNIALTIRDLIDILNYQWDSYNSRSIFRKINKSYIRVFEPHKKDGVPHIHALLYIPSVIIPDALEKFKELFFAPRNIANDNLTPEQKRNGEINGFQWTLSNPTGYVMKYISKTFMNLDKQEKLDNLASWYVTHKVRRILTSRSTIPLWVYRKIFFMEKDLYTLTNFLKEDDAQIEWDFESQYIRASSVRKGVNLVYHKGEYSYSIDGRVIKEHKKVESKLVQDKPVLGRKFDKEKYNFMRICKSMINLSKGIVIDTVPKPFSKMTDLELFNYSHQFDREKHPTRYEFLEKELIKRGLKEKK